MTTRALLLALPAALLLAACGGSDGPTNPGPNPNPNQQGTFTGTVAGGLAKSVTGHAVFGTSVSEGGFALVLGDENDGFIFGRELAGIPGVGAHAIYDFENDDEDMPAAAIGGVFGLTVGGTEYLCTSTGGTLTITSSSNTRLQGSVNVTASCTAGAAGSTKAITLTGQFTGVGAQVD